jgi:hypothetical protein
MNYTEAGFAEELRLEFEKLKVICTPEFELPVGIDGDKTVLDLYLSYPWRAFVEINMADPNSISDGNLALQAQFFQKVFLAFKQTVVPVFVTIEKLSGEQKHLFQDLPVVFIAMPQEKSRFSTQIAKIITQKPRRVSAAQIAQVIRNKLTHPNAFDRYWGKELDGDSSPEAPPAMIEEAPMDKPEPPGVSVPSKRGRFVEQEISYSRSRSPPMASRGRTPANANFATVSKLKVGDLNNVVSSLAKLVNRDEFEVLNTEISEFYAEIESEHYTAGALRIGRTLESVIYVLARAWEVPVNKVTVKIIEDLQDGLNKLSNLLIEYGNSEGGEKVRTKQNVENQSDRLLAKVSKAARDIDEEHDLTDSIVPINIDSLLRDIKKKFGCHEAIREELEVLISKNLVSDLLKQRNRAAHADTSGNSIEFTKSEIEKMIANIREILFRLVNIAANIKEI